MTIHLSLGGSSAGDGFLLAPLDSTYPATLELTSDAGPVSATLQAVPNPAGLVFSTTSVSFSAAPTTVTVHATAQSVTRGDTVIQVLDGATVVASVAVTSVKHPVVGFGGRFQARFATDGRPYNDNPMYTAAIDTVNPPGWTFGLEGEPDFVPAVGNVPENLETSGPVGRTVRLNNPVALRTHVDPIASTVTSITGETTGGTETFTAGDPLIGQQVDFGPNTYLAGNQPIGAGDDLPEELWDAALEPMALFELHLGGMVEGASLIGPFTAKAVTSNVNTRVPDHRPIANGLLGAAGELASAGLPTLSTFSATRIDQLVADHAALPPGASTERRNLVRRIGHLLQSVTAAKRAAVQAANPGAFTVRTGTLPQGWSSKEVYEGEVNTSLVFNPGASVVATYLGEFGSFNFRWTPFAFHSDELCGHHRGTLTPDFSFHGSYTGDPHTFTVNGVAYDFQAVGEFTLLRDGERMEIQVRQTPVQTNNPVTDGYTGLTECVSLITAVAVRLGEHRISLQPAAEGRRLDFFVDGKRRVLPVKAGLDLGAHRVSTFDANGETGVRIDYPDGTAVTAAPRFWNPYDVWYINVTVAGARGDEGVMGFVPRSSWLPRLRDGSDLGPMPASLDDRHKLLYVTFADSWRIADPASLFTYAAGTSTKDFTDPDWPAQNLPCTVKPELDLGKPILAGMPVDQAEKLSQAITVKDLFTSAVFDLAATGDETLVKDFLLAAELRTAGTVVTIEGQEAPDFTDRSPDSTDRLSPKVRRTALVVRATVASVDPEGPVPTGEVTFHVDGVPQRRPVPLDGRGRAKIMLTGLKTGRHLVRAAYAGGGRHEQHASSSANLPVKI